MSPRLLVTSIALLLTRFYLAYLLLTAAFGGWIWADGGLRWVPGKLADPILFTSRVRDLEFFPDPWNAWGAMALPWLECLTGLALLLPWTALGGAVLTALLMALFGGVLVSVRFRGLELSCGCFGGAGRDPSSASVVTIAWRFFWCLLAVMTSVFLWKRKPDKINSPRDKHPHGEASPRPE